MLFDDIKLGSTQHFHILFLLFSLIYGILMSHLYDYEAFM